MPIIIMFSPFWMSISLSKGGTGDDLWESKFRNYLRIHQPATLLLGKIGQIGTTFKLGMWAKLISGNIGNSTSFQVEPVLIQMRINQKPGISQKYHTKNGFILPTGQWYAPSAVINHAWYCMVLHDIAWYCVVLHGIAWYCMVLHCIA